MRVSTKAGGVLAAASAIAAAAYEFEHRSLSRAELSDSHATIRRLGDFLGTPQHTEIGAGLSEEWGSTAFLGFGSIDEFAREAGDQTFVAQRLLDDARVQTAVLQTICVECGGDPERLAAKYLDFAGLLSPESWRESQHGGDTVILLQITVLGSQERGAGLGSLLRDAALHLQPREVRYALTMTPVDSNGAVALNDRSTFTAAMRFHMRGGGEPVLLLPGYRAHSGAETHRHSDDVVVMRYERDGDGAWPSPCPPMRIRRAGPLQRHAARAIRGLHRLPRSFRSGKPAADSLSLWERARVRAGSRFRKRTAQVPDQQTPQP
jgi:hypothetical protein